MRVVRAVRCVLSRALASPTAVSSALLVCAVLYVARRVTTTSSGLASANLSSSSSCPGHTPGRLGGSQPRPSCVLRIWRTIAVAPTRVVAAVVVVVVVVALPRRRHRRTFGAKRATRHSVPSRSPPFCHKSSYRRPDACPWRSEQSRWIALPLAVSPQLY